MKLSALLPVLLAALATARELPAGVPRSVHEFRAKHPFRGGGGGDNSTTCRKTVTIRASRHDADDVSDDFYQGLKQANHGGTLSLPRNHTYVIGKPLDLTWLDDVHVHLEGEIRFTNDTPYWQEHAFAHPFQNSLMFWKWGGKDIKIYGEGVLNGNGQRWWNEFSGKEILDPDNAYLRPILFYAENVTNLAIEGVHLKDSPCWTTLIVTSKDIAFRDVICTAESNNATALPKNSDFFDSLNVENVSVERTWVNVGDDCFSPKSNITGAHVDHMYCNGTHGQSMGSLGQYAGEKTFAQDVLIENVWMLNGEHGARLKSWAGPDVGYGFINNITFRNVWNAANDYTAFIDSCYFNIDSETCAKYPSKMNVTNVRFQNFTGYTNGKYGRAVAKLTCSTHPDAVCEDIHFEDFNVESPCGPAVILCDGIKGDLGVECISAESEEGKLALAENCTVPQATASPFPIRDF